MTQKPVIAIDGPAASGKGTLARRLAEHLNYAHLDTGALYRAVAFSVLEAGGDPHNEEDALKAAQTLDPQTGNPRLKDDDIGTAASKVAAIPAVRDVLKQFQHSFAETRGAGYKGAILDGRDIGTVICPDANVKLFIIADIEVRAKRRAKELQSLGKPATYEAVLTDMRERDARDQGRQTAPMKPADDAVIIDTGHLDTNQAFDKALQVVAKKLS